jgi:prevent-host-death family protein
MKTVGLRDARDALSEYVDASQRDSVVIMRHGKPAAVIVGVEGEEMEEVLVQFSLAAKRLLEVRRAQPRTSLAEFKRQLLSEKKTSRRRAR